MSTPFPAKAGAAVTYLFRAMLLRCPWCGRGRLFSHWFRMKSRCPACGLRTERGEEGYVVGSYMFNMIASELVFAGFFIGVAAWSWPSPPWDLLLWVGVAMMIVAPFVFYPFSKSLFLAFDLVFRPATEADLAPPDGAESRPS